MKLTEIKQCPWCGGEIKSVHYVFPDVWYLICHNCGYRTDIYPSWERARKAYERDKAKAIKALEQTELNSSYNGVNTELKPCDIDAIVEKIKAMQEKDAICKYPYSRCINVIREASNEPHLDEGDT